MPKHPSVFKFFVVTPRICVWFKKSALFWSGFGMVCGVARQAEGLVEELRKRLPAQRKTQRGKLALLVAAVLHARSANLMAVAASLPLDTERRTCVTSGSRGSSTMTAWSATR